jgi:hypothetical protein
MATCRIFLSVPVLCLACCGAWLAGCEPDVEPEEQARPVVVERAPAVVMVARQGAHDFGEMTPLSTLEVVFLIENPGAEPLVIKTIKRECDCTEILETGPSEIAPGDSSPITVLFEAPEELGRYVTRVVVLTEDPNKPTIPLVIRATIVVPGE